MAKKQVATAQILDAAIEGIRRIKGKKVALIDLTTVHHTECSYFIICHGASNTQVDAIAHSVEETVEELTGTAVWHKDGYRNAIWILLDYGDVMVHVFREEARNFYSLESLWADAAIRYLEDE
ncbi:MAG TPA: ribosome silencing factor [Prolixibacteraceae bacterium]|nr:ribosome silencing factor [Prolixibacteraceae bacterium]